MQRYKIKIFLLVNIILAAAAFPQSGPLMKLMDLPNLQILEQRQFSSDQLYGYMNGGAELYREYGFKLLVVQDVKIADTEFSLELFEMSDVKAAFGIYSISTHRCKSKIPSENYSCITPYRILAAKGSYFITVTNMAGDSAAIEQGVKICKSLLKKIKNQDLRIPDFYRTDDGSGQYQLKYFRGKLALQNNDNQLFGFLKSVGFKEIWQLKSVENEINLKRTMIFFQSKKQLLRFLDQHKIEQHNRWQKFSAYNSQFIRMNENKLSVLILNGNINFEDLSH